MFNHGAPESAPVEVGRQARRSRDASSGSPSTRITNWASVSDTQVILTSCMADTRKSIGCGFRARNSLALEKKAQANAKKPSEEGRWSCDR
jgi:hypothetical protein